MKNALRRNSHPHPLTRSGATRPLLGMLVLMALLGVNGCNDGGGGTTGNESSASDGRTSGGGGSSNGSTNPVVPEPEATGDFRVLAYNDLGMHCADADFSIFSILPPYNVLQAQVIERSARPRLVAPGDGIALTYEALDSQIVRPADPAATPEPGLSRTSTSQNSATLFKTNFWDLDGGEEIGRTAYDPLYPPGVLAGFDLVGDLGLPAPEVERLHLGDGQLAAEQAAMPGILQPYRANDPQPFHGFIQDFPFFVSTDPVTGAAAFPFGYEVMDFNRYTAEGVPIMPTDDRGRTQAYPMVRVEARDTANVLHASVDVVLPVASEADCQGCHLDAAVCDWVGIDAGCGDIAHHYDRGAVYVDGNNLALDDSFDPNFVPGDTAELKVINAAKINILRLHDAKHSTTLDATRKVVCATCHYSPALDLAQLGPNDSNGKEQTRHVSMSRAMHAYHAGLPNDAITDPDGAYDDLFPIMPPPGSRTLAEQTEIQEATCYACHPGKRTQCQRGAMAAGGMVCQDCHGQGTQVGNDFSIAMEAGAGGPDWTRRVPWASEPHCESCHLGDVLQVERRRAEGRLADVLVNDRDRRGNTDGLRLLLAYPLSDHSVNGGTDALAPLRFTQSRFAADQDLYRLSGSGSQGHAGIGCEGCHGSTHAIWPVANPFANDNRTAIGLQGHSGTLIECSSCHTADLGNTLGGPHGLHPVGNTRFADGGHEDLAERNPDACRACHGRDGEGTVLARAAADRAIQVEECENGTLCPGGEQENVTVRIGVGVPVTCGMCHQNPL